jgi:uncharacterized membrane protein
MTKPRSSAPFLHLRLQALLCIKTSESLKLYCRKVVEKSGQMAEGVGFPRLNEVPLRGMVIEPRFIIPPD